METLLPVIVGGLIGLAGGIAGPPLSHWLNEGSARRKKRAEKLEEMIGYIYAHDHWIDTLRGIRVFGAADDREPSPLSKAQAIAAIYFPQFTDNLNGYSLAAGRYALWMLEAGQRRVAGDIANVNDGGVEAHRPYYAKHLELLDTLAKYAASEFAASSVPWKRTKKVE